MIVGTWSGSLAVRMTKLLKDIGCKEGSEVKVRKEGNKIIIEKVEGK
jgi:antitoxin component of MazEF toxin-antitoxin module